MSGIPQRPRPHAAASETGRLVSVGIFRARLLMLTHLRLRVAGVRHFLGVGHRRCREEGDPQASRGPIPDVPSDASSAVADVRPSRTSLQAWRGFLKIAGGCMVDRERDTEASAGAPPFEHLSLVHMPVGLLAELVSLVSRLGLENCAFQREDVIRGSAGSFLCASMVESTCLRTHFARCDPARGILSFAGP